MKLPHAGDWPVDAGLAARLLSGLPDYAGLPLTAAGEGGTENVLWRIGEGFVARYPRKPGASAALRREARWLPRLVPDLPLAVPVPLVIGEPGHGYPFAWSVSRWLAGENAQNRPPDPLRAAAVLAETLSALHALPVPSGAPRMTPGRRLRAEEGFVRKMIATFRPAEGDRAQLSALFDAALALPEWRGPPVWCHADLHPLNLLSDGRELVALLDWQGLNAGDPAQDLIAAWTMFDGPARSHFRARLSPDPLAWERARGFALSMAIQAIPWYRDTNPRFAAAMRATLARVLADGPQ